MNSADYEKLGLATEAAHKAEERATAAQERLRVFVSQLSGIVQKRVEASRAERAAKAALEAALKNE